MTSTYDLLLAEPCFVPLTWRGRPPAALTPRRRDGIMLLPRDRLGPAARFP
jgi:hypothetical protein